MKYFVVTLCFDREKCDAITKEIMLKNKADGYVVECVSAMPGQLAYRGKIYFNTVKEA